MKISEQSIMHVVRKYLVLKQSGIVVRIISMFGHFIGVKSHYIKSTDRKF